MKRNWAVFEDFGKGGVVIALRGDINHEANEDHEEGKTLDRINRIDWIFIFRHEFHE